MKFRFFFITKPQIVPAPFIYSVIIGDLDRKSIRFSPGYIEDTLDCVDFRVSPMVREAAKSHFFSGLTIKALTPPPRAQWSPFLSDFFRGSKQFLARDVLLILTNFSDSFY